MPYILVTDFKQGLDRRRMAVASPPGTLQQAKNAHINRGGEVEKSKAWPLKYALPADTFGLEATASSLYVFGSVAPPVMPSGVLYQRLQHPDGLAMTALISSEIFGGKIYAIAEFTGGQRFHFYDGALVGDWYEGVVRSTMVNMAGVATHLASLVDAHSAYAAASTALDIDITGPAGRDVEVSVAAVNGGSVTDQSISVVETTDGLSAIAETRAIGAFTIYGGSVSAGVNEVQDITVNGVSIISGVDIDYTVSNEVTAQAIADAINSHTSTPDYSAAANGATVTISAGIGTGATPNGHVVEVTVGGNIILCTGSFEITDGTSGAGNQVTSVSVNGSNITTAAVLWATSHSNTAALVVSNINANSGVSGYNAWSDPGSAVVYIGKLVTNGTTPGGLSLKATSGGTLRIDNQSAAGTVSKTLNTSVQNMKGGVTAYAGTSDVWRASIGGTFDVGDKFTITIEDPTLGTLEFGASRVAGLQAGSAILTHKKKLYLASGSTLIFSGVSAPDQFHDAADAVGSGTIDIADEFNGSIDIRGLTPYQGLLAIMSRRAIQIWSMDTDPAQNRQVQVLSNIGTLATKSIKPFGDSDAFFLSDSGIRSLRARAATDTATVSDVGTPIDDLVVEALRVLPASTSEAAVAEIEPTTGRYMLQLGSTIYVFTYFPGGKISAWSTYELGSTFSEFAVLENRVYARAGSSIYLLGGDDNNQYDATECVVELPYLDGRQVATWKDWVGVDVACEGTWSVYVNTDPNDPTEEDLLGTVTQTTFALESIPLVGLGPLLKLRFVNTSPAYGRISMVVAHYMSGQAA